MAQKRTAPWKFIFAAMGGIVALCFFCLGLTSVLDKLGFISTSTPTRTATSTVTLVPTSTTVFTSTVTNIPIPSNTSLPTATSASLPTATLIVIIPTQPAQPACSCSGDIYNCGDFSTHSEAQSCFSYCNSIGAGDIHRLDKDGNGLACESLP